MALLSKKEFAEECGMNTRMLAVYIKRKKVFVVDDLIDTTIQANADFMQKSSSKKLATPSPKKNTSRTTTKPAGKKEKPVDQAKLEEQREKAENIYTLDKEKKQLDIEKIRTESALLESRLKKLNGELLPTSLIQSLFIQHSENIKNAYRDASENLITIISQQKEMSSTEVSGIKKEFSLIINKAVDSAIDNTKRNLKNIIAKYSQTRSVGQHD